MKTKLIRITMIALAAVLTSCIPQKKMLYFQDRGDKASAQQEFVNDRGAEYRVQQGDILYVRIMSIDADVYSFEQERVTTNYYSDAGIYLNSYSVDGQGNIAFPLLGNIPVEDKPVDEIQRDIQVRVDEYVKNTTVIVKLANFTVTLLGEFSKPGKYLVYQDDITIFQAIAMAGDMTDYAKRGRVVLVRQTEQGTKMHRLDLNDQEILSSDFYYLLPNDIVYVEPMRGKQFAFTEFPYGLLLSTVTLVILIVQAF